MKPSRWTLQCAAAAAAGLTIATALPTGLATASSDASGPTIKLVTAQKSVTATRYGKRVFLDPGIYVTSAYAPLEFDVRRASYSTPLTITQVIRTPGQPPVLRPLPARTTVQGWQGLRKFLRMTVKNAAGKIVAERVLPFCPDSWNAQRSNPYSAASSHFPMSCQFTPFQLSNAWGIQRGWGVDPLANGFQRGGALQLALGRYTVKVDVTAMWRRILHITPGDATATVRVSVVKPVSCFNTCAPRPARRSPGSPSPLPAVPAGVPVLGNPPASILPDLVPLPSSGIRTVHFRNTPTSPSSDQLSFGATIWIGGHSKLDVQGFRSHGSPTMQAFQYFWRDGRIIGRARAGTMGFDGKKGHEHWHFEQFAQYRLLNSTKSVAVRSQKVGFCIAPTTGVSLLVPHAVWQPRYTGFGQCGSPTSLWVRETLPLGWGDTYFQWVAGQAFNISHLPNGTYYIEVIANPGKVLHESNYADNVSLRKVIIGGTRGNRTVRVPAYHGIDPEH